MLAHVSGLVLRSLLVIQYNFSLLSPSNELDSSKVHVSIVFLSDEL
jgi:hypothetical protein